MEAEQMFRGHSYVEAGKVSGRLPWWLRGKEPACQCRRHGFPWVGKIPWRREWQPTLVSLPEESHGQRSLMDYSAWDPKRVRPDLVTKHQQLRLSKVECPLAQREILL